MKKTMLAAFAVSLAAIPGLAMAEPVPAAVDAMIRAAGKDVDTIAKVAKTAHPNSAAEIDALVASLAAQREVEREERLARAGIFDAWSGEGELGVNYTTGNTRDFGVAASLGLTKDGLSFRHKLKGLVDRQKSNGLLTRDRSLADYELNYKFNDRLYAYGLVGWERNSFAGFSRRFTESVGAGYSVLDTDDMTLDVTAGPAFQQTRYVDGRRENDVTARAGLEFAWAIRDDLKLSEKAAWFIGNQWTSTTALTFALTDALSSRASFDIIHEDNPPLGRRATDTATRLSLVYGF
jgi:putative salt-induced outer membrane protein